MRRFLALLLSAAFPVLLLLSCQKNISSSHVVSEKDDRQTVDSTAETSEIMEDNKKGISEAESSVTENSESLSPSLNFQITDTFFPQCFQQYMVPPSILYGEYIISNPYGENSQHTRAISLDNHQERDLGFYGWDVKADSKYYYWMDYSLMDKAGTLTRTDKNTLESTSLLKIEGDRSIYPRMALSGDFIVWAEGKEIGDYLIKVYNIKQQRLEREIPVNYYYHPTAAPDLCGDWLVYVEVVDERYRINCLNLTNGEQWWHDVSNGKDSEPLDVTEDGEPIFWSSSEPIGITTDGRRLFWSSMEGIFCCENGGEETIIHEGALGTDVAMLMDRYIVYGYDFNIYVYDTATKKIVFSGDPGEKLDYGGFFNISEDASKAVFQGWTHDDPEKYYIMLLEPTS